MKKIKLSLLLIIVFLLGLVTGCNISSVDNLFLQIEDNKIYWNEIVNAERYYIYVNDQEIDSTTELYFYLELAEGNYTIIVKPYSNGEYGEASNRVFYNLEGSSIKAPVIKLEGNKLSWEKDENAVEYNIYLNNILYKTTTETSIYLNLEIGTYHIKVQTCYDISISDFSNEIIYKVTDVQNEKQVTIFEINDTHGAFESDDSTIGIAKVGTIIHELEQTNTLIKIANGDIFQGGYVSNMSYGRCFIDAFNELQFDCFVIGNHEFDWGLEKIADYKDGDLANGEANFPFLAANIIDKRTSSRPEWLDEYTIVEKDNQKIGIIGLIGEGLTSSILSEKIENYQFTDELPIIKRLVPELRQKGCDFVVVSIHDYDEETNSQISYLNEEMLPDALVCAHTHQEINEELTTITDYNLPVVQSKTKNLSAGTIVLKKENNELTKAVIKHYYPKNYDEDESVLKIITLYQDLINESNQVVGYTTQYLSQSILGYFACEAIKNGTSADIAIINTAGVRSTIGTGNITMKEVYEAFPFDNYIYIVDIGGSTLKKMLNEQGSYLYYNEDFSINSISNTKTYKLAIIDYVYTKSYYDKYFNPRTGVSTNYTIRKYVVDELLKALEK